MFFLILMRIFRGHVRISLRGGFPERFLNLCAYRGVEIWNLKRKDGIVFLNVMASDYRKLRAVARKTGVKMRIEEKTGLPFVFFRYRRRPGIPLGVVLFFGFLVLMARHVWVVDIRGLETVPETEIRETLRELGLSPGVRRAEIHAGRMKHELLLKHKDLAWASVNLRGSLAEVEVRETEKTPPPALSETPVNLRAARDGRIVEMEVYEGTPMVREGEAVLKDDLLVASKVEYASGETAYKHARAKIKAETLRSFSETIPLRQVVTKKTGEKKVRTVLSVFGLRIPLYLGSVKGEYELKTETVPLVLDGVTLPISLGRGEYRFTRTEEVKLTPEEALRLADERLQKREKEELAEAKIQSRKRTAETFDDRVKVTIIYSCVENISVEEILLINEAN